MFNWFTAVLRRAGFLLALLLVVYSAAYWVIHTPGTIAQSVSESRPADQKAAQVEKYVLSYVKKSKNVTVLYLNPYDMGDNFYRLRYALYPIRFVPYWSWTLPNQGGYVWRLPVFTTVQGLRKIMLADHVNVVLAVDGPQLIYYLHKPIAGVYLFRVNEQKLKAGDSLAKSLVEVARWS